MSQDILQQKVMEYCRRYNRGLLFNISAPYDVGKDWSKPFPNADCAGCYAIFSSDNELLYIGKASNNETLGRRLTKYWRRSDDKTSVVPIGDWGAKVPRIIRTIAVDHPYEAPSLEEFLIGELRPPSNSIGLRR